MGDRDIARAARRLRLGVVIGGTLLLLIYLAARLGLGTPMIKLESRLGSGGAWGPLVGDLLVVLLAVALLQLVRMLRAIEGGELFSARVIGRFRGFALWVMLFALAGVAFPLLLGVLAHRPGEALALRLDVGDLLALGGTLLLFLLARLLERARRIEDEMREIV